MDTSPSIVVVDGDPDAAGGAARLLDRYCAPAVAETDPDAVLRGDVEPACLVCEYDLAGRTGFDLLAALRERSDAPVVFYTGAGDEAVAARAVSADVAAYVPKDAPDAESRLVTAVGAALADGESGTGGAARGVAPPERALDEVYDAARRLPDAASPEAVYELAARTATDALGLPAAAYGRGEEGGTGVLRPVETTGAFDALVTDPPAFRAEEGPLWAALRGGDLRRFDAAAVFGRGSENEPRDAVAFPLAGQGALVVAVADGDAVSEDDRAALRALATAVGAALVRLSRERRISALHEATRALMTAPTEAAVARAATETARDVLDLSINSVFEAEEDRLVPVAATDEALVLFDEVPALRRGESIAWTVYETGEPRVYADVAAQEAAENLHNPETPARSELVLPLGDYGVFIAGSTAANAFGETLVTLARVFADTVGAAMERAAREETLRRRERELARQNERLDEFAGVVSHDLRNPLNVAAGHLGLAIEAVEEDHPATLHLESVAGAHRRMERLVDDVLALARQGRAVGETRPVSLEAVAREAWAAVDGGVLALDGELGTVEADPERLRALLENLFSNAVDHGGADSEVAVETTADGFAVVDDGPGVLPEDRRRVFEAGYTTAAGGTGFGLAIVASITDAHGWEISLDEGEEGGARFEVRTGPGRRNRPTGADWK